MLALACGSVAILASAPFDPAHASRALRVSSLEAEQLRDIGVAPLGKDEERRRRIAPTNAVEPLAQSPKRPAALAGAIAPTRSPLMLIPLRVRGRIGDGLYESLEAAGLAPATASAYLKVLSAQRGIGGDIGADDHFDLVIASRGSGRGNALEGTLLYAAIDRVGASDVRVMRWPVGGSAQWVDAGATEQRAATFGLPVAGRITSGFGIRHHPILNFARSHRGVDFAARWGAPIIAVADGQVVRSGWAGAYGRQVQIAHGGGLSTSYSHMSRTAAVPGGHVRAGQVIGYVGSSGLSTGPHLHYEVRRGGVAVNPLAVRFAGRAQLVGGDADRFRARLSQFLALGVHRPS